MAETTFRSSGDKVLAVFCHLGSLVGLPVVLPLVIYLCTKGDRSLLTDNAREALNFHLSVVLYVLASWVLVPLFGLGFLFMGVVSIGALVLMIIAAVKTVDGGFYRYPLTLRMVKG